MEKYICYKTEELKAFVANKRFLTGLVLGFAFGVLHHYFGL
ncbi:unknown [Phascolarctobacterium succinatutens CAG:287]|uniref:Uncharacterized protein n=1 Tax=Phascolarctobacterium succinatutens CAG:287 TaxID=1263101 RepID=R6WT19_9FIRM|nr:hypothetical protein [Phascolarctobacterium succinatutens]CDD10084.1 unknown [Phascolarctobacterium succinatutens CAG:287]